METKNSRSEILSENFNSTTKLFMDTTNAMVDTYNKQFESGTYLMNKFLNMGPKSENKRPVFNSDLFHSGFEIMKKNMEDFVELSRKNMPSMMNLFGWPGTQQNGHSLTETVINAYTLQAKQLADANKWFMDTFVKAFNISGEQDRLFAIFQKNSEKNFKMAEEGIRNALDTYTSITNKTNKEMRQLVDTITEQMQFLSDNNMKEIWAALLQTKDNGVKETTEHRASESRSKEKHHKK